MLGIIKERINSKLSTQLMTSFLGMFLMIIAISSFFLYSEIVNILKTNTENNSISQFKQYEYNINTFSNEVDMISRQIVINNNLQDLIGRSNMDENERIIIATDVFKYLANTLGNYKFIDSIVYYCENGLTLKASSDKNNIIFAESSKKDPFYKSNIFNNAKIDRQKLTWYYGYSDVDFKMNSDEKNIQGIKPKLCMSAARTIFSGTQVGTLILNINMNYFTSIYNSSTDILADEIYIMNKNGEIISHPMEEKIGQQSTTFRKMDDKSTTKNFVVTDAKQKKQITYYKLGAFGWILVSQVPVKIITNDIIKLRNVFIFILIFSLIIAAILSRYWIYKLIKPLNKLTSIIKKIGNGKLGLTLEVSSINEIGVLVGQFNKMSTNIQELFEENELVQEEKRIIEMDALRAQINPHFIYNTLNTIKWMGVIIKADNIVDCITTLSELLKPIFKTKDIICTLEEEIDYTKNYIKIMNYRLAGGIKIFISIAEEFLDSQVLRFILQPVVENAIVHGLFNQTEGELTIRVYEQEENLIIEIEDNGEGIAEEKLLGLNKVIGRNIKISSIDNSSIGLANVNRRVKLHFGDKYGLEIKSSQGEGTVTILKLPLIKKN
jgi:two-component system sensor histidine kinase YesM